MFEALTSYTTRQANAISAWLKTIGASMPTLRLSTRMAMPVGLSDRLQKMRPNVPSFQGFSMQHNARLVVLLHMGLLAMTLTAGLTLGYVAGHMAAYVSIAAISVMARGSFKAFFTALQQYVAQLYKQPAIMALLLTSALCMFYVPLATAIGVESVLLACTCVDVILLVDNAFWKMVLLPSHVHFSGHWSDRLQVVLRAWVYLQQAYAGVESTAKPVGKPDAKSAVTPDAKSAVTPEVVGNSGAESAVTPEAVGNSGAESAVTPVALTTEVELTQVTREGEGDQAEPVINVKDSGSLKQQDYQGRVVDLIPIPKPKRKHHTRQHASSSEKDLRRNPNTFSFAKTIKGDDVLTHAGNSDAGSFSNHLFAGDDGKQPLQNNL